MSRWAFVRKLLVIVWNPVVGFSFSFPVGFFNVLILLCVVTIKRKHDWVCDVYVTSHGLESGL